MLKRRLIAAIAASSIVLASTAFAAPPVPAFSPAPTEDSQCAITVLGIVALAAIAGVSLGLAANGMRKGKAKAPVMAAAPPPAATHYVTCRGTTKDSCVLVAYPMGYKKG